MERCPVSASTCPTSSMLAASRRKSSSSTMVSANSSMSAGGCQGRRRGFARRGRERKSSSRPSPSARARRRRAAAPLLRPAHRCGAGRRGPGRSRRRRSACGRILRKCPRCATELGLDDAANGVEGFGGHTVAKKPELGDDFFGRSLSGGEDLAELDVGRTELSERDPQTPRQPDPRARLAPARRRCTRHPPPCRASSRP